MNDIEKIIQYSRKLRLLYVEDNKDSREMTSMILSDFFDNVIIAVDGEDGYNKFVENKIDVIITDINMPKMNGLDMIEKIKKIDEDVSILILSAHNEEDFFLNSIKLGIDGYILKPIDLNQLIVMIDKVVNKYRHINEAKENLHLLEEYQRATNKSSIVSKTDKRGIITFVNDKFCEISGYTKEELLGKNHNIVRHPDNPKSMFKEMWHTIKDKKEIWQGIVRNKTKDNRSYYVDSLVMPVLDLDGNILEYISLRNDITHIMNPAKQLNDAIENAKNPILIYFKMDKYDILSEFYDNKTIESIQDELEKFLQKELSKYIVFEKVYQLSNGEFAILSNKSNISDINVFIQDFIKILKELNNKSITIGDILYDISLISSVVFHKNRMLESARLGIRKLLKNKSEFIVANNLADAYKKKAQENLKTISLIKEALQDSRIVSYFQPIVDNKTREIVKYESLVRLLENNGNILSPYFFLEIAKKSSYYTKITDVVLEHSFDALQKCDKDITINLSAIDIEHEHIRSKIFNLLNSYSDMAKRIVFELLEDETIKDFNAVKSFIFEVKKYGVKIAIDDFGSGYSNYIRLLEYGPDILKIDGSLIKNIKESSYSLSIVKSIVTFAKEQKLQTVAEFVENEDIYNIVKDLGVDYSQGYYFGKPRKIE